MNPAIDNKTRAVSFFHFHGMTMIVAEHQGKRYVEAKPFGDLLGMKWRSLRDTVQAGDNAILYGAKRLLPPVFNVCTDTSIRVDTVKQGSNLGLPAKNEAEIDVLGPTGGPLDPDLSGSDGRQEPENTSENGVLFILFERVQMFLARVNTSNMRVKGNVTGANYLLALQIEWAQVLHGYEAGDVVSKKARMDEQARLSNLMKTRELARPCEQAAFDRMLRDAMAEMGYPIDLDPQQTLPLTL